MLFFASAKINQTPLAITISRQLRQDEKKQNFEERVLILIRSSDKTDNSRLREVEREVGGPEV